MFGLKSKSKSSQMSKKWWSSLEVDDKILYTVKDKGKYIVTVAACQGDKLWIQSDCGTVDLLFDPSLQQENIEEYTQRNKLAYFIEKGNGGLAPAGGWTPEQFSEYLIEHQAFNVGLDKAKEYEIRKDVAEVLNRVQLFSVAYASGISALEAQLIVMDIIYKAMSIEDGRYSASKQKS